MKGIPIVFFDLETTGKSATKDRIVTLSAKKVLISSGLQPIEPPVNLLINPQIPISAEATAVHGITDDMVRDSQPFAAHAKELLVLFSGCCIAGYNCKDFDIPMLSEEFARAGITWPAAGIPVFDGYTIFSTKEERSLTAAVKFYTGEIFDGAHDASNDVDATIKVFAGQLLRYPDLAEMDEEALSLFCARGLKALDLAGKIVLNDQNVPVYSFGKSKGVPVVSDRGFGEWMLKQDFSTNTKAVIRSLIYK